MKIEQSQAISDRPFNFIKSKYFNQETENQMNRIIKQTLHPPIQSHTGLIVANPKDIFFLVMAILGQTSHTTIIQLPFEDQRFHIDSTLNSPIYLFLRYTNQSSPLSFASDCEADFSSLQCPTVVHGKLIQNESLSIEGFHIDRNNTQDQILLDRMKLKYPNQSEYYQSQQIIQDEDELYLFYGVIYEDMSAGLYNLRVKFDANSILTPLIVLVEFGLMGDSGMFFSVWNWIFFILTAGRLIYLVVLKFHRRRLRL